MSTKKRPRAVWLQIFCQTSGHPLFPWSLSEPEAQLPACLDATLAITDSLALDPVEHSLCACSWTKHMLHRVGVGRGSILQVVLKRPRGPPTVPVHKFQEHTKGKTTCTRKAEPGEGAPEHSRVSCSGNTGLQSLSYVSMLPQHAMSGSFA